MTTTPKLTQYLINAAAFVIIVAGMKAASSILVLILLSVFIVVVATPLFVSLQRRGLPTWLAFMLLMIALLVIGTIGVSLITTSLTDFARNLPDYQAKLQGQFSRGIDWLESKGVGPIDTQAQDLLNPKNAMAVVGNTITAITGLLSKAFIIILVAIFMLFETAILPAKIRAMPGMNDDTWSRLNDVMDSVRQYMGMKSIMSMVTGLLVGLLLTVVGVDYPILLGMLAFLLNYVPNVGSFMAAVPGVLLALLQFGPMSMLGVAIGYVCINVGVSNFIEPRFMGKGLGMSPMIIIISLIFWGWVLGPIGMLLSVPLTMTAKIALQNIEGTRGLAILIGGAPPPPDGERP